LPLGVLTFKFIERPFMERAKRLDFGVELRS
jgi:hypothetical protein